jgi:hypothetical protein
VAMRRTVPGITCLVSAAALVFSQTPAEPPKPGRIEGRVIDAGSGDAVRKVLVVLRRGNEPGIGTYTGSDGKFSFNEVEPGPYTLSGERDGYTGGSQPKDNVVNVKPGDPDAPVTLKMRRTGALSGRVLDVDGDPVAGASVQVLPLGKKKPGSGAPVWASTNDRGEYRAYNIPSGRYHVSASYSPRYQQNEIRLQIPKDAAGPSPADPYVTTYYPRALDPQQASIVQLDPGADLQGIDVQLLRAKGVRIGGRVFGPGGGSPATLTVINLEPLQGGTGQHRMAVVRDPKGEFEFSQVLPGKYIIGTMGIVGRDEKENLTARRYLEVGSTNIDGVELTLALPQTIAGSVTMPPGRRLTPGLMVILVSREKADRQGGGFARIREDGTFSLSNVPPGDYDLMFPSAGAADDLYVAAIRMGDEDALAEGVHVGAGKPAPVVVSLKPNGGTVECSVLDADRKPVPDANVMLMPDPPRRMQVALHGQCRTDAGGSCTIEGVTPGEYQAFVTDGEFDLRDVPDSPGKPVKIGEGERKKVELEPPGTEPK